VLVVEDDPAMPTSSRGAVGTGFTVEAAPTAAAGLDLERVTRFDLITPTCDARDGLLH